MNEHVKNGTDEIGLSRVGSAPEGFQCRLALLVIAFLFFVDGMFFYSGFSRFVITFPVCHQNFLFPSFPLVELMFSS